MSSRNGSAKVVLIVALAAVCVVAFLFWYNPGYGKVSPRAYEMAKALYGACLAKSDERIGKVEALLGEGNEDAGEQLSEQERSWIDGIISKAESGNWEAAAKSARRMMEDQVEY